MGKKSYISWDQVQLHETKNVSQAWLKNTKFYFLTLKCGDQPSKVALLQSSQKPRLPLAFCVTIPGPSSWSRMAAEAPTIISTSQLTGTIKRIQGIFFSFKEISLKQHRSFLLIFQPGVDTQTQLDAKEDGKCLCF